MHKENLVFLPDSPYCKWIIERCEYVHPGRNRYICLCADEPKYPSPLLEVKGVGQDELVRIAGELKEFDRIILHYHFEILGFVLEIGKINPEKVVWVLWSGDLYNSPFFDKPIYLPKTLEEVKNSIPKAPNGIMLVKEYMKYLLKKPGYYSYKKSFKRIGTIASFFDGDVAEASRVFKKEYKHLPFALLSFEELFKGITKDQIGQPGELILLGHAGVPENNHLDLFSRFENLNVKRKLVCPLSYGSPNYIQSVSQSAVSMFGERIELIFNFMPREEYYLKLSEMGFAVFNTLIQQAFGNILGLLYLGVKVFLDQENSIYQQLKKIGIIVFSMDELTDMNLENQLSLDQIIHNREILKSSFTEEKVIGYYRALLKPSGIDSCI